mgnify:CR=1 FL=1
MQTQWKCPSVSVVDKSAQSALLSTRQHKSAEINTIPLPEQEPDIYIREDPIKETKTSASDEKESKEAEKEKPQETMKALVAAQVSEINVGHDKSKYAEKSSLSEKSSDTTTAPEACKEKSAEVDKALAVEEKSTSQDQVLEKPTVQEKSKEEKQAPVEEQSAGQEKSKDLKKDPVEKQPAVQEEIKGAKHSLGTTLRSPS